MMIAILISIWTLEVKPHPARLFVGVFDACSFYEPTPKKSHGFVKPREYPGLNLIAPLILSCFHKSKSSLGPKTIPALELDYKGRKLQSDISGWASYAGQKGFFDVSRFDRLILSNPKMAFIGIGPGYHGAITNTSGGPVTVFDTNGFQVVTALSGQTVDFDLWPSKIWVRFKGVEAIKVDPCDGGTIVKKSRGFFVTASSRNYPEYRDPQFRFLGRAPLGKRGQIEGYLKIEVKQTTKRVKT